MPQQRSYTRRLLVAASLLALAGCGGGVPDFLGRSGGGDVYTVRGEDQPDPVPMAMRSLEVEPALNGTILRVDLVAPTQGYHSARLIAQGSGRPDPDGTVGFVLTAVPPKDVEATGPERTRTLRAAVFVPNRAKRQVKSVRILDAGGVRTVSIR